MDGLLIKLELFAFLAQYYPAEARDQPHILHVPVNATARGVVAGLNIPEDVPVLVYVNNRQLVEGRDHQLEPGDVLGVMPVVLGG